MGLELSCPEPHSLSWRGIRFSLPKPGRAGLAFVNAEFGTTEPQRRGDRPTGSDSQRRDPDDPPAMQRTFDGSLTGVYT